MLELPYTGRDLSMFFLLPDETDGLAALEDRLTVANLDAWTATVAPISRSTSLASSSP